MLTNVTIAWSEKVNDGKGERGGEKMSVLHCLIEGKENWWVIFQPAHKI